MGQTFVHLLYSAMRRGAARRSRNQTAVASYATTIERTEARVLLSAAADAVLPLDTQQVSEVQYTQVGSGSLAPTAVQGEVLTDIPELTPEQAAVQESDHQHDLLPDYPNGQAPTNDATGLNNSNASELTAGSQVSTATDPQAAGDFQYFRNVANRPAGGSYSSTNEPSVGTIDSAVFMTGNWYASVSGDNGQTFSYINPYTTFPATWGGFCCDQRVAHDPSRDMAIWYLQYIKDGSTSTSINGVRVAIANSSDDMLNNSWNYYDFVPDDFGLGTGKWLDFPHMQVSNGAAYFTSNVFSAVSDTYTESVAWRVSLDELEAGGTINFDYFVSTAGTIGLPVGATDTMYPATRTGANSLRVWTWADSNTGNVPFNDVTGLSTTFFGTHTSIDNNGNNWTGRSDSRISTGWVSGNELGFMWNSAQGTNRPNPFVRAVVVNTSTKALISEPDLWSSTETWHYPAVAVNARGHIAGTVGHNFGNAAVDTQVIIDDDFTSGWEAHFGVQGTDGPGRDRWGDYLAAQKDDNFQNTWIAAGFSHSGSTTTPQFFWFGRERDNPGANLKPESFDVLEEPRRTGDPITIDYSLINEGAAAAGASRIDFYVSRNSLISTADRLIGSANLSSIAAGATRFGTASLTLPAGGDSIWNGTGTYYIGMIVDGGGQVTEYSESDNSNLGESIDSDAVSITVLPNDPDDQFSEANALGSIGDAMKTFANSISSDFDVDMVSFNVDAGQRLAFDIDAKENGSTLDSYIRLFNSTGSEINFSDDDRAPDEQITVDSYLRHTFVTSGMYYLGISAYGNSAYNPINGNLDNPGGTTGNYVLEVSDVDIDGDDEISEATPITLGVPRPGFTIGPNSDVDMFRLSAAAGQTIGIDIDSNESGSTLDSYIRLFDAVGNELAANDDAARPGESASLDSYLEYTFATAGNYYIGVSSLGNTTYDPVSGHGDLNGISNAMYDIEVFALSPSITLETTSGQTTLPGAPYRLLPFARVTDGDSADLNGFRADVRIVAGLKSYDRLWLLNESGQRLAAGASIILAGVNVGTVTETGMAVRVVLNSNATFNHLRSIYNRVEYENVGTNVTSNLFGQRTLAMRVIDIDTRIDIAYYNLDVKATPKITLDTTAGTTAIPGAPFRLLPFASVTDLDAGNLNGFRADVRIVVGRKSYDRLWLLSESGQRLSAGASIVLGGVNVGTVTEAGFAVRVVLNSNATLNHLRSIFNRVEYENVGSNVTSSLIGQRTLAMRVIDTDTLFDNVYYTLNVQGRPEIALERTSSTVSIAGPPFRLLPFATVNDVDAGSLNGYRVDMYFDAGRKAYDRLWLLGENGQRLTNGSALILNGVNVGTVIENGLRVKVQFNANATFYHARVIYNRIEFENLGSTSDPSLLGARRLELRVRDTDGNIGSAYYNLNVTA